MVGELTATGSPSDPSAVISELPSTGSTPAPPKNT